MLKNIFWLLISWYYTDLCRCWNNHCPEKLIGIYDYSTAEQKVYPNPGYRVVSFDFTLPKYTEKLKMTIKNILGNAVLVPIENEVFNAGEHSVLINVNALPNGVYYIIIEARVIVTAQPLTIVR